MTATNSQTDRLGFAYLDPDDFPFTIWALRSDDKTWCWAVTLYRRPTGGALVPLKVPPLADREGVTVDIVTMDGRGRAVRTGPYGEP